MRKFYAAVLFSAFLQPLLAQEHTDPFKVLGVPNTLVYTDLKTALKSREQVYKMNLGGPLDPKLLPKIGSLVNLQVLKMGDNGIHRLPDDFAELHSLQYFSTSGNYIDSLPKMFGNLSSLMYLELIGTKLDSISSEFGYLDRLKSMNIRNNQDTLAISPGIGYMSALTDLQVSGCALRNIPAEIGRMPALKNLSITKCGLASIPDSIGRIKTLEVLILDNNKISRIPGSIFKLKKLRYLSLQNNQLTPKSISDHVCFLTSLETLDLRGNNSFGDYDISILKVLLPLGCQVLYK